jgi:hypothetical protein
VVCMEKARNAYRNLVGKPPAEILRLTRRGRWESEIKMEHR